MIIPATCRKLHITDQTFTVELAVRQADLNSVKSGTAFSQSLEIRVRWSGIRVTPHCDGFLHAIELDGPEFGHFTKLVLPVLETEDVLCNMKCLVNHRFEVKRKSRQLTISL